METKNIILKLRTERGMSQDELADIVMVTRQAVSRWENGDTVPNTDTLKLLSKEFDVSINTLLGEPRKLICQCCGMPIDDDSILGRDKDGTLNEEYCKWCYADGTYTYNDMDKLTDVCVKNMVNEIFDNSIVLNNGVKIPQLCIRYTLQLGIISLPKTGNPEHMKSNAELDFEISAEEMELLKNFTVRQEPGARKS